MGFKSLKHLDLSDCDISGLLPASLTFSFHLQHLNFSGNPRLSGKLPDLWGRLTDLQVVDVSDSGVSGPLPEAWATMQKLKVFRASKCKPGVSGQLPQSWGFLEKLEVLDVSGAQLTGTLPAVWADSTALAARAAGILKRVTEQVAQPSTVLLEMDQAWMQEAARAMGESSIAQLQTRARSQRSAKLGTLQLQELRLSGNELTGQLPGDWAALKQLQVCVFSP